DGVLGATPTYRAMDFTTRDSYRHAIEELARGSSRSELDVARAAALYAERAGAGEAGEPHDARHHEVGYYLVGNGRATFEQSLRFRGPPMRRWLRAFVGAAVPAYLGTIAVLTGCLLAVLLVLGCLALVPASDLVIALVNRGLATLLPPSVLPRLDLREGVPSTLRTLVVVPTLLADPVQAAAQIEGLEVHYLSNPDGD